MTYPSSECATVRSLPGGRAINGLISTGSRSTSQGPENPRIMHTLSPSTAGLGKAYLNAAWFLSMADARSRLNEWRDDYNQNRPHSALGNLTLSAFAALLEPARKVA